MLNLHEDSVLRVSPVASIPADAVSCVGHADTAAVLGVACNRVSISLDKGDELYVAQLVGGRLPEGSTTLPDGFHFNFVKVTLL